MPSYYEEHKEERKAYQNAYRDKNIDEVRRKDNARKRKHKVSNVFKIEHNVKVHITDTPRGYEAPPTVSSPSQA